MSFVVSNLNDAGVGSFREAITLSNAIPTLSSITFSTTGEINLLTELPQITSPVSINSSNPISINANSVVPLLTINTTNQNVVISNITLRNGFGLNTCAGITSTNTILQLQNINIHNCISEYNTSTSNGALINCNGGSLAILITDEEMEYGNISDNIMNFSTDIIGGLIVLNDCPTNISGYLNINNNNCISTNLTPDKIEGAIISLTNSSLQLDGAVISNNNTTPQPSILGSLIYYDGPSNIIINNTVIEFNGEGNNLFNYCINIITSSINMNLYNVNFNNMMCKAIYCPTSNLIVQDDVSFVSLKSIAIVNTVNFTSPSTNYFQGMTDDDINGCLGFEIRASSGVMNYTSLRFDDFVSTSPNSIASAFYFPNLVGTNIFFTNSSFVNMNAYGQAIKFVQPNLNSIIDISDCAFFLCISQLAGTTISFDNTQSKLILSNTIFNSCVSPVNGGALYITSDCELEMPLTTATSNFTSCSAPNGGAIYLEPNSICNAINNANFNNCSSTINGGAIYTEIPINIIDCQFTTCSAVNGGAIIFNNTSNTNQLISSINREPIFDGNTATDNGGAIYCINDSTISLGEIGNPIKIKCTGNGASNGGFLYATDQTRILFLNTILNSNTASNNGGAIYLSSNNKTTIIDHSPEFDNNIATNDGGHIYIAPNTELELHNTQLLNSNASRGGSIYNYGTLTLNNCTLTDQVSSSCLESSSPTTTYVTLCNITSTSNSIVLNDQALIKSTNVSSNAIGITLNSGDCEISECAITDGQIGVLNENSRLSILNTTITNNEVGIQNNSDFLLNITSLTIINTLGIFCSTNPSEIQSVNCIISSVLAQNTSQIISMGYNLIINDSGTPYFTQPTDINNADPILSPFQDNGGPTLSYMPLDGSPTVNAGTANHATEFDQRGTGYARVINGQIDIGSIESENEPICFTNDTQLQLQLNNNKTECITIQNLLNMSNLTSIHTIHGANKIEVTKIISTNAPKTLIQINKETNPIQFNPTHPTHFTDGHILILNDGQHIKAKNVQNKTTIQNTTYTNVYSLITETTASVKVNNINTLTMTESKYNKLKGKGSKATIVWSNK